MRVKQQFLLRSLYLLLVLTFIVLGAGWVSAASPNGQPASATASPEAIASPVPQPVEVAIERLRYRPFQVEVSTGTTVRWTNNVSLPHTVTNRGVFDSGSISKGGTFERTFSEPGNYWYECLYHQEMVGVVVVRDS